MGHPHAVIMPQTKIQGKFYPLQVDEWRVMSLLTFDTPVLKVEGLFVKFDTIPVSGSNAVKLGGSDA